MLMGRGWFEDQDKLAWDEFLLLGSSRNFLLAFLANITPPITLPTPDSYTPRSVKIAPACISISNISEHSHNIDHNQIQRTRIVLREI